nr:MAG TPA: hypothetical protein [Caudoviricetes sp.]
MSRWTHGSIFWQKQIKSLLTKKKFSKLVGCFDCNLK